MKKGISNRGEAWQCWCCEPVVCTDAAAAVGFVSFVKCAWPGSADMKHPSGGPAGKMFNMHQWSVNRNDSKTAWHDFKCVF